MVCWNGLNNIDSHTFENNSEISKADEGDHLIDFMNSYIVLYYFLRYLDTEITKSLLISCFSLPYIIMIKDRRIFQHGCCITAAAQIGKPIPSGVIPDQMWLVFQPFPC